MNSLILPCGSILEYTINQDSHGSIAEYYYLNGKWIEPKKGALIVSKDWNENWLKKSNGSYKSPIQKFTGLSGGVKINS